MTTVWVVTLPADVERNFTRKSAAVRWLRRLTSDERIRPVVVRRCAGAYTFYGPGKDQRVLCAPIDRCSFSSLKLRRSTGSCRQARRRT